MPNGTGIQTQDALREDKAVLGGNKPHRSHRSHRSNTVHGARTTGVLRLKKPRAPCPPTWAVMDAAVQVQPECASVLTQTEPTQGVTPSTAICTKAKTPPPRPPLKVAGPVVLGSQPPFKSPPLQLQGPLPQQPLGQSQEVVSKLAPRPRPSAGAAPPSAELPLLAFARPSRPVNMPHGSTDVLHVHPKPSGMLSILVPPPAAPLQHSQPSLGGPVVPFCTVRTVSPALGPLPQLQGLALKKCAPTKGKSVICKASSVYVHSSFTE